MRFLRQVLGPDGVNASARCSPALTPYGLINQCLMGPVFVEDFQAGATSGVHTASGSSAHGVWFGSKGLSIAGPPAQRMCWHLALCRPAHSSRFSNTARMCAKSLQSCLTLCHPMDSSPPGSSVHGILQARILEWVAMPSSRESSRPREQTHVTCISCIASGVFTSEPPGKPLINLAFMKKCLYRPRLLQQCRF